MLRVTGFLALASLLIAFNASTAAAAARASERVVPITVTRNGFEPATIRLKAGQPVRLVVTRKVERTCATEIVIPAYQINKPLPLNKAVDVRLTPKKSGQIRYACAMDMIAGSLVVE